MKKSDFSGKVAIVTGASSGIGMATALALAKRRVKVTLAARRCDLLQHLAQQIEEMGGEALPITTDISSRDHVRGMVMATLKKWDQVDMLISNAGQYIRAPISDMTFYELEQSMAVNFYGGVYAIMEVLPHMLARRSGHIVLVSSIDAKKPLPIDAPYVAAKCALSGFGEVLRQELHGSGVYASTVYPGRVDTGMIDDLKVPWISRKIPPEAVTAAILTAIERKKPEVMLPFQAGLLVYTNLFFPRFADWIARVLRLEGWN